MSQQGFSYEGDITLQRYSSAGVLATLSLGPLEILNFSAKAANEQKDRKSNRLGMTGKTRGAIGRTLATEIKFEFNAVDADIYALMFLGSTAALSVTGGTVTGESITGMAHNKWYKLAKEHVSALASAGKTINVDFEMDGHTGRVRTLSTGTIADNATVAWNYTYSGITGSTVRIGTESKADVKIFGDLRNRETLTYARLRIPQVTLSPDGEVPLIADDYASAGMTGKCVLMDGETADCYLDDPAVYA